MTKRKSRTKKGIVTGAYSLPPPPEAFGKTATPSGSGQVEMSASLLHDLFAQQAANMLQRADLDEEQKQEMLIAMSCPCCGVGGMSITAKLKRRPRS